MVDKELITRATFIVEDFYSKIKMLQDAGLNESYIKNNMGWSAREIKDTLAELHRLRTFGD